MNKAASYFFICNPAANSGRMKKQWSDIENKITTNLSEDYDFQFTDGPGHGLEITQHAIDQGYTHLISVGGDGIANEVVNGIIQSEKQTSVNVGMLPAGTSNDSCLTHQLGTLNEAISSIAKPTVKTFPVGKLTGDFSDEPYYFFDHADTGIGALSAQSAINGSRLLKGEIKYTFYAIRHIFGYKGNPSEVIVDGNSYTGKFAVAAVSLGQTMGGYKLWPENSPHNPDFGIILVRDIKKFKLLRVMLASEKGKHLGNPEVDYIRGKEIEINLGKPWPFQAEGEIFTANSKVINIEYIPDQLNVITNI